VNETLKDISANLRGGGEEVQVSSPIIQEGPGKKKGERLWEHLEGEPIRRGGQKIHGKKNHRKRYLAGQMGRDK